MPLEHEELTGTIIGAAIEVHRSLGPGFLESVYENAMTIELRARGVPFERQVAVPVRYRGLEVGLHKLDLIVDDKVIVELKAVDQIVDVHFVVVRSYLRAVGGASGLILNFAHYAVQAKRVRLR